jgi:hypothetical protein
MAILHLGENDEPVTIEYDYLGGLPAQPAFVLAKKIRVSTDEHIGWAVIDTRTTQASARTTYESFDDEAGARAKYRFL